MASEEARARWLRSANLCFVEESHGRVSRTPNLPPSSSVGTPSGETDSFHVIPDVKWWLDPQPNYRFEKMNRQVQLDISKREIGGSGSIAIEKLGGKEQLRDVNCIFPAFVKNVGGFELGELEAVINNELEKKATNEDTGEIWSADESICNCKTYEQSNKLSSEMESQWVENSGPWWRKAEREELTSFVSNKSFEHFENCDLPQSHKNLKVSSDQDKGLASLYQKTDKEAPDVVDSTSQVTHTSVKAKISAGGVGGLEGPFRKVDATPSPKADEAENPRFPHSNLSKAQLLEALCHSQTRAREAEDAAQKAFSEKEHIVRLFFRQASHIFAYKQWLQILQLETLYFQLKNSKDHQPLNRHFPDLLPWFPMKNGQKRYGNRRPSRRRRGPPICRISKRAFAFVMGLSLAGAGLLLGWTMGWLFPFL